MPRPRVPASPLSDFLAMAAFGSLLGAPRIEPRAGTWSLVDDVDWKVDHTDSRARLSFHMRGQEVFWIAMTPGEAAEIGRALKREEIEPSDRS